MARKTNSKMLALNLRVVGRDHKPKGALAILVPTSADGDTPILDGIPRTFATFIEGLFASSTTRPSAEGTLYRAVQLADVQQLVVVRTASPQDMGLEELRVAAAHATRHLAALQAPVATLLCATLPEYADTFAIGQALAEGAALASYSFDELKKKPKKDVPRLNHLDLMVSEKGAAFAKGVAAGLEIAESVNLARSWGDHPGNLMTPTLLAESAQQAARGLGIKVTVWGRDKIAKEKMGCFLGVSKGSKQEPKLIIMEYAGAGRGQKPLCFVGKGLTFDSGGISIKPSAGMEEMKYDMCGGANVLGALIAIARLKLKVNAIAIVPATENMPGPDANKPGDICFARNGLSVEVNNTDAEGRLILADALVYASEMNPRFIVDAATLTGAMSVALGNLHTGYFCRDEDLNEAIQAAARRSGERVWRMPMVEDHLKDMKGTYADLSNISSGKGAGSATAAAFLGEFVDKKIPWAHFDIAGTAWHTGGRLPYCPKKGASGAIVRTFVELAREMATGK